MEQGMTSDFIDAILSHHVGNLPEFELPSINDVISSVKSQYNLVDLQTSSAVMADLCEKGISQQFLSKAQNGVSGIVKELDALAVSSGIKQQNASFTPRVQDAAVMIKTGSKWSLSPWNGNMEATVCSVGPEWFFFESGQSGYFVGQGADVVFSAQDTIWVVPRLSVIFHLRLHNDTNDVYRFFAELIHNMMRQRSAIDTYIEGTERQKIVTDWHCEHFGHYVWNVLSAWGSFFKHTDLEDVNTISCNLASRFFGPITKVVAAPPQIQTEISLNSVKDSYDLIYKNNALMCSVKGIHLDSDLCKAVVDYSLTMCESDFVLKLTKIKATCRPLILISLRRDNRFWLDQEVGFIELIKKLKLVLPDLAVAIHGLSSNVAMGWTTSWMSLDEEINLANRIEENLASEVTVVNTVGRSIHEAVAISALSDIFVAPIGSGMALYKWITNIPGVCFSNSFCLDKSNPKRWAFGVFDSFRDDLKKSIYLPISAINDADGGQHGLVSRANFHVDQEVLYNCVLECLKGSVQEDYPKLFVS